MRPPWLLIDCNYLCYRAHYSMGDLSYEGIPTGVVFGFLREILQLQDSFYTSRICFTFDRGPLLRSRIYPAYKSRRKKDRTEEEILEHRSIHQQIQDLRKDYLPFIGYSNIFSQKGYEADDIIASLTIHLPKDEEAIIVSSDSDLLQLLSKRVSIWNPGKQELITKDKFENAWGMDPGLWAHAKAIAGCSTDDIEGVKGVGEKTAAEYLKGKLSKGKKFDQIVLGSKLIANNLKLVTLPFPGVKDFTPKQESIGQKGWARIAKRLGMRHLFDNMANRPRIQRGFSRKEL